MSTVNSIMEQLTRPAPFKHLAAHRVINLTTFRKSGVPVTTPVWFAPSGEIIYVYTGPSSGKVKRIRNSPQVEVAPATFRGKALGEPVPATARILTDAAEIQLADRALGKRYGWQRTLIQFINRIQGHNQRVFIAIQPSSDR